MKNTHHLLEKYSDKKILITLLIITFSIYFFMIYVTIPNVQNYSNGIKILDLKPGGYDNDYVKNLFETLGKDGRDAYLYKQIPLDMVYPGLFIITISLYLYYLIKRLNFNKCYFLILLPLLSGVFDYFENICIITMLKTYPVISENLITVSNTFTILKSIFTTITFTVLFLLLLMKIFKKS